MLLKISALGIIVSVLCTLLNKYYKEAVLPLQLSFVVLTVAVIAQKARSFTAVLSGFLEGAEGGKSIFSALIKGALICVITKIASDIAKDSGNSAVSDVIDLAGRVMILALCFPFVENALKTALSFVS